MYSGQTMVLISSKNVAHKTNSFFSIGEFAQYLSQKYPTYFARVFWSNSEYNLSHILDGYFQYIYWTNYGLNKLKKHGSQNRCFTILSHMFCGCILVGLRVQFVRYLSRIFPICTSDKLCSE